MKELPSIELVDSITGAPLGELATDLTEVAFDAILDDGLFRDIPVVGGIVALFKTGANIRDRLFLKKVLLFLKAVSSTPPAQREHLATHFPTAEDRRKFGESVFLLLERADDMNKPELIGHLWAACAATAISYDETVRLCHMVDRVFWSDLSYLKTMKSGVQRENTAIAESLQAAGFVSTVGVTGGTAGDFSSSGIVYEVNEFGKHLITYGLARMG